MYKKLLLDSCLRMLHSGLTVETWGNISVRDPETGLVYLTPSAMKYEELTEDDVIVCKADGSFVQKNRKPTIEMDLHLAVYRKRADINAVLHTHPIHSQVFAVLREDIPPVIDEAAQIMGGPVRCAKYALPGSPELAENCVAALGEGFACLLANHGAVCLGATMDAAFRVSTVLEMTAHIYHLARAIGKPVPIDQEQIDYIRDFAFPNYKQ
jgi:L-fuculose-phosphate aldolase